MRPGRCSKTFVTGICRRMESAWRLCVAPAPVETLEFPPGKVLVPHQRLHQQRSDVERRRCHRFRGSSGAGRRSRLRHAGGLTGEIEAPDTGMGSVRGLAWTPSGKEIWFTASENAEPQGLMAVDRQGKLRDILRSPGLLVAARYQHLGPGVAGRFAGGRRHLISRRG